MFGTESDPSRQFLKMTTHRIEGVSKRHIAKQLGVSKGTINRYMQLGVFCDEIHYIRKFPNNNNSPLLFFIDQCTETYMEKWLGLRVWS
mgnify:FL=1